MVELTTPDDVRGLRRHGRRRRRRHGPSPAPPCARWCCPGPSRSTCTGSSPSRPSCADCGPASRTAPSSPCRSPRAPSSAPAPSSWWHGTEPGSRATHWPAPCRGVTRPGPTPTPNATWPGRPRTAPSTVTSSRTSPPSWPRSATSSPSRASPRWWPSARWPTSGRGSRVAGSDRRAGAGARTAGVLDLLERLHPTPAVGGTPRADALAFIADHEAGERGHWAGPVGWVGADGDGEWMIGIRSAQLDADGATLTCGPAAGSWPTPTPTPRRPRPT